MKTILKDEIIDATYIGGSCYVIIDSARRQMMEEQNIGGPFDKAKHRIRYRTGVNHKGEAYSEFWFVKRE